MTHCDRQGDQTHSGEQPPWIRLCSWPPPLPFRRVGQVHTCEPSRTLLPSPVQKRKGPFKKSTVAGQYTVRRFLRRCAEKKVGRSYVFFFSVCRLPCQWESLEGIAMSHSTIISNITWYEQNAKLTSDWYRPRVISRVMVLKKNNPFEQRNAKTSASASFFQVTFW